MSDAMLAVTYAKFFAFVLVRKLFSALQGLLWLLNGTFLDLYRSKQEGNYHRSAQLLDVVYRYKLDLVVQPSGSGNFITKHNGFVSPSYILQDNVTLFTVTATEAMFVETPEDIDVSHSDYGSFIKVTQFRKARRIIKLPIAAFHKIAEEIGDPKGELVFVTMTSRCGSTLLTQIFEETGCCIGLSEPDAFRNVVTYKDTMPQDELDTLLRNCIRMQCKPIRNRPITAYILKLSTVVIDAVPVFVRLYPNSKQIFIYREGLKVAQSLIRTSRQMPVLDLMLFLTKIHPRLTERIIGAMGFPKQKFAGKVPSPMTFCIISWGMICRKYLDLREQGIKINAVKYEDLMKHPLESIQAIFQYCNLPAELVESSAKALNKDSQRHSPLSMKKVSKAESLELQGNDKVASDALCDMMGLPRIPEPCNLEGTITTFPGKEANGATQ